MEDEGDFYFDHELDLDTGLEDQLVAAELMRPERLDTVEEVSEPPSGISSQLTSLTSTDLEVQHSSLPPQSDLLSGSLQSSFSGRGEVG